MGIQDDAWLRWGPGTLDERLATLDDLGVKHGPLHARLARGRSNTHRPTARNPSDPAYDWAQFDAVLDGLHAHGITPLVTIWGAPEWSNGGHRAELAATQRLRQLRVRRLEALPVGPPLDGMERAEHGRVLPSRSRPRCTYGACSTRRYASLHQANRRNVVGGGVTSPRATASGMSPTAFMQGMRAAHARLDAYAANPYPSSEERDPVHRPLLVVQDVDDGTAAADPRTRLRALRREQAAVADRVRLPDEPARPLPRRLARAAGADDRPGRAPCLGAARRDDLIHFLVKDEPSLGGWQSGLFTAGGAGKPAKRAFALPLAQMSRRGTRTVLWGQVRPGSGRRTYVIQRWTNRRWVNVGSVKRTGRGGTFRTAGTPAEGDEGAAARAAVAYPSPLLVIA